VLRFVPRKGTAQTALEKYGSFVAVSRRPEKSTLHAHALFACPGPQNRHISSKCTGREKSPDRLAEGAVTSEPVSAVNREKYRENYIRLGNFSVQLVRNSPASLELRTNPKTTPTIGTGTHSERNRDSRAPRAQLSWGVPEYFKRPASRIAGLSAFSPPQGYGNRNCLLIFGRYEDAVGAAGRRKP
jgi:hypothetical protein